MITGELKSRVDRIWDTMWSGGISNPLTVIEQLTYLLFVKRLDELHTLAEKKANRTGKPIEDPVFDEDRQHLRWSRFRDSAPEKLFETIRDEVFPFIKALGQSDDDAEDSTYSTHMRDALFVIPSARVLSAVVDQLDAIDMTASDTKGDLYEYMLGKIASAGQNGQFRTPAPHHRADGGHDGADAVGRHLRPGLRHGGLSRRGLGVPERAPRGCDLQGRRRPEASERRDLSRLRLRLDDAQDRQHEHAAARGREP